MLFHPWNDRDKAIQPTFTEKHGPGTKLHFWKWKYEHICFSYIRSKCLCSFLDPNGPLKFGPAGTVPAEISILLAGTYDRLRRVSGSRREPVVSVKNPTLIPTSHWDRVGIIFLSGMLWSVWGSSRRLQVPYVIPRPCVPRHIYL